jgi:DNA primase
MITEASLEALKARIDIVDVVGNYVELKKAGANFKAPCPFHDEKSASFVVSPAKQIYHCFGCHVGGDAIKFVQEYKKLDFTEAVEEIAADLNFTLEYSRGSSERKDYAKLMEHVNRFYRDSLIPQITDYLHDRGLTDESIERFEIGYAPASHDAQIRHIKDALFNENDAVDVGVLANGKSLYARLTDRVTFPIRNHAGKLIGFGGRVVSPGDDRAKYLNSPQTKLFDKSRQLYGYHIAKEHIYKKGTFTVTEGYMDVVMFHQAGIRTAVATMGTALTEQHCHVIKKAGAKTLLCYDGDRAGRAAAFKAAKLLSAHEVYGGVVLFPEGKDPADMVKSGDAEGLFALMKRPTPLIPFVITETAAQHNLARPDEKQKALREIIAFLNTLPPLIRDEYRALVAATLQIDPAHVVTRKEDAAAQHQQPMRAELINIAEMSVIKTAAEDDALLDAVLDFLTPEDFRYHKAEYDMLMNGDQALHGRLLSSQLKTYTADQLTTQLRIMRISKLEADLSGILTLDDDFERKAFNIKRIKGEIMKLKKELNNKETYNVKAH